MSDAVVKKSSSSQRNCVVIQMSAVEVHFEINKVEVEMEKEENKYCIPLII